MSDDKAIRVIAFSGKQVDWTVWEEKFMAKANSKGYRKVLLGTQIVPKDDDNFDETTAEGKILKKARATNEHAYTVDFKHRRFDSERPCCFQLSPSK